MAKTSIRVKVKQILPQYKSPTSDFTKTSVIGVVEGGYPETFQFDFNNKKQDLLDDILEGTYVTMFYNMRGREVIKEGKDPMYFISLDVWAVELK